ncbi:hypothetical protein TSUD_258390 [Trifolium subterraneum]|uniref:Uncharacterized protein n=1 Tax=Trifolium subterraneum TaxID=3900 RepID=A0A2Z6NVQ5_TRISU|nr:hypothetical protein TSUD_258390 [Trifolium subterraneum]
MIVLNLVLVANVSKNGQELTGRNAYRHYRKESGESFKKSKRKTSAKKADAKKQN